MLFQGLVPAYVVWKKARSGFRDAYEIAVNGIRQHQLRIILCNVFRDGDRLTGDVRPGERMCLVSSEPGERNDDYYCTVGCVENFEGGSEYRGKFYVVEDAFTLWDGGRPRNNR